MAIDQEARTSRRGILAAALGGAGALIASRLGSPTGAQAANGDPAVLGQANTSTAVTSFQNTQASSVTLKAINTDGDAIQAEVTDGHAIQASASGIGSGVNAVGSSGSAIVASNSGATWPALMVNNSYATPTTFPDGSFSTGVMAVAGNQGVAGDPGAIAANTDETGVYGFSNTSDVSNGLWGDSWDGTGVYGTGSWGVYGAGYDGVTGVGSHIGVHAQAASATAYALWTDGRIRFNGRSGRTYITSGHHYKDVVVSGMTTSSWVLVTLGTYRSGYYVAAAISYAGKFRMYLNKSATSTIYFSYIVMN